MLLFINRLFFKLGGVLVEPKSTRVSEQDQWLLRRAMDIVSGSHQAMDMRVNQTHITAPLERPYRRQIVFQTQQWSRFKYLHHY